jgi:hypothetical protein
MLQASVLFGNEWAVFGVPPRLISWSREPESGFTLGLAVFMIYAAPVDALPVVGVDEYGNCAQGEVTK